MTGVGELAELFDRCMSVGGIAVFGADTVYGLACDPSNRLAVQRLYGLKRRALDKPSAVMFFELELALAALPELGERTRGALHQLLPGGVTVLLDNPAQRFPLACGADTTTLGLRVPVVPGLQGVSWPVLQSSANLAGGPDARALSEVPEALRRAADLVLDAGELPGTPSTVIDLRNHEQTGAWSIVRAGQVSAEEIDARLHAQYSFDAGTYDATIQDEIAGYHALQDALVSASGEGARRVLELGTGTGETARRLLARHPDAELIGIDENEQMLAAARERLADARATLRIARLEDPLPDGPFDLVASALAIHHLSPAAKRELFMRVRAALRGGGTFVLADGVVPADPADARIKLTPGFDRPDTVADQLAWLGDAGLNASVMWETGDLAVLVARLPG